MTEIQAIIDKLESEKAHRLSESNKDYCDKVKSLNYLMHRVNEIETVVHELKKYLPIEDKSKFRVNNLDNYFEYISGKAENNDVYRFSISLIDNTGLERLYSIPISKVDIPTIISTLQVAHEEMKDD